MANETDRRAEMDLPTECSCGAAIVWDELPLRGEQAGWVEDGRRYWCELRNCTKCRTTLGTLYSAKIEE